MKFKKNFKKGFTLVELIVVIAIVAILAAVSVVSYIAFINSANESADIQLVKQLNTCLQADEALHGKQDYSLKYNDLTNLLESNGFIVENLTKTKSGCDMVYQGSDKDGNIINRYALLRGDNVLYSESTFVKGSNYRNLWIPETFDEAKTLSKNGKGVVLGSELGELTEEFEAHASVIVNGAKVENIKYINNSNNSTAQNVIIQTEGGSLTVNDRGSLGKVLHYGSLVSAEVITDNSCFYSHGKIAEMTLKAGKVVAAKDGVIALVNAQPIEGATVEASKEDNGILYIPDGTSLEEVNLSSENLEELGYEISGEPGEEVINGTAETIADNSYKIENVQDLLRFRDNWNRGAITVHLPININADLDITGIQWAPMGNWKYPFYGQINGNKHTIKGLTATQSLGTDGVYAVGSTIGFGEAFGFIGIAAGTININNINLSDANISLSNGKNVGSFIAYAPSNEKFKKDGASFADNKWASDNDIGTGLSLTIQNVNVSGKVEGQQHVGGIVGKIYSDNGSAQFNRVKNTADVTAVADNASGIVGYKNKSATMTFNDCHNEGDISAGASSSTGLVGLSGTGDVALITLYKNCSTTATCKLTGSGTNSLGKYNSDKTALEYQAHKANTELVGDFLLGGPSLSSQHQPTFVDPNND